MNLAPLLTPLARLLISLGIPFRAATEALRRAYVHGAGVDQTDSRISMVTGLQRRDIARIKAEPVAEVRPDPLSRLVARWVAEHDGADLPRRGEGSFDGLAGRVFQDVHPRSLLDGLVEAGTVADEGESVRLLLRFHRPGQGSEAARDYLVRNVGDHLSAAGANLSGPPAFFERAVHYNHLSPEAVAELEAAFTTEQVAVLERLNAMAVQLQDRDRAAGSGTSRFRAGGYFYQEADP